MAANEASLTSVVLTPPSHAARAKAGLGLPSPGVWVQALAGVTIGAAVPAVFIHALSTQNKDLGAILTGTVGGLLAAISPVSTFGEQIGFGAFVVSAGFIFFSATGQFSSPTA